MAALQCEICGGKLMAKSGGLFECEYCGMQYDKTRIQEMVQEIKGTVQVEGTVEVTGKVQLDTSGSIDALLKRGNMALEDRQWEKAKSFFEQVLNVDAECAEAYLGIALAQVRCSDLQAVSGLSETHENLARSFYRALQFAQGELKDRMEAAIVSAAKNLHLQQEAESQKELEKQQRLRRIAEEKENKRAGIPAKVRLLQEKYGVAFHLITCGYHNTIAAEKNNRYYVCGNDENGQHSIAQWKDVVEVSCGIGHFAGLKKDGTVVAHGYNRDGRCNVSGWKDITAVFCSSRTTIGLKMDGSIVVQGDNEFGQSNISGWKDIVEICCWLPHTVGLKKDGTVVACGLNRDGQCNVSGWSDIISVSCGNNHTVGLKRDGTVVACGLNREGQCNVSGWTDIISISCGNHHTVGIKKDGTVVACGDNDSGQCDVFSWTDIIEISCGRAHTVGLKADGRMVACGNDESSQCNVQYRRALFDGIDDYIGMIDARIDAAEAAVREMEVRRKAEETRARQQAQWRDAGLCQHCGGQFKGLFGKKCANCGKPKDY